MCSIVNLIDHVMLRDQVILGNHVLLRDHMIFRDHVTLVTPQFTVYQIFMPSQSSHLLHGKLIG